MKMEIDVNSDVVLPIILESSDLQQNLNLSNIRIVDLCKADIYPQAHIPGAVHLDYEKIIRNEPPIMGLLPPEETIGKSLSSLGISSETHVIAYDDEGGGKASRLLWTLAAIGHTHFSLLNGGFHAWANEGHPVDNQVVSIEPVHYRIPYNSSYNNKVVADKDYIIAHLRDSHLSILDCRSPQEYNGETVRAERAGHIPNAVNMDWTLAMDPQRNYRIKAKSELQPMLNDLGITRDKEVIVYCHSHHRSAHTFIMLKSLGYKNVKGYPGSWSEWGNLADTPIDV